MIPLFSFFSASSSFHLFSQRTHFVQYPSCSSISKTAWLWTYGVRLSVGVLQPLLSFPFALNRFEFRNIDSPVFKYLWIWIWNCTSIPTSKWINVGTMLYYNVIWKCFASRNVYYLSIPVTKNRKSHLLSGETRITKETVEHTSCIRIDWLQVN